MWIKLVNPRNSKEWSYCDPAYAAALHPGWKRVPPGCERARAVLPKAKQPTACTAVKTKPPPKLNSSILAHPPARRAAREARRADPLPRTVMEALQAGHPLPRIREWQRMGLLPL
ncbi:MAG: hypothetical protein JOY71_18930 [Acetobacteraceae bacterium]|nr:hypothetical protein [Acetobacteraceae bacterium]MBV8524168.1 hypothetical protein [Acetobacteraceae bacterium]